MVFEIPEGLMVSVSGVRGRVGEALTPDVVAAFGAAFGAYLGRSTERPVVVLGRDSRTSGPLLSRAVSAALEGARLVFASRYLIAIMGILGFYEIVSNIVEFQFSSMVEASAMEGTEIDAFFGMWGWMISGVSIVVQLLLTPYLMNRWSVGAALMVGAFVRWSAFWGAVMMLFYWASSLQGGLLAGLPLEHGWVVNDHIVYAVLLFGLGAFGAGRILGVDAYLEQMDFAKNNRWVRLLLG